MRQLMLLVLSALLLSACTTTTVIKQPYGEKINKAKEVEARVQIALIYLQKSEPERAISELERAMDVDPKSARVHEVLAIALETVNDDKRAEKHFKKMLKYDEHYTRGRANYGSYLMRSTEYKKALEQFSIVVDDIYYPKRAIVYQQMAECSKQLGKKQDMLTYYKKAADLDKSFAPPLLDLAEIEFKEGNYPKSQEYFTQYRKKVTQSSAKALLLGIKLAQKFQDKNAQASYALALKNLYPHSQEYLDYLKLSQK